MRLTPIPPLPKSHNHCDEVLGAFRKAVAANGA